MNRDARPGKTVPTVIDLREIAPSVNGTDLVPKVIGLRVTVPSGADLAPRDRAVLGPPEVPRAPMEIVPPTSGALVLPRVTDLPRVSGMDLVLVVRRAPVALLVPMVIDLQVKAIRVTILVLDPVVLVALAMVLDPGALVGPAMVLDPVGPATDLALVVQVTDLVLVVRVMAPGLVVAPAARLLSTSRREPNPRSSGPRKKKPTSRKRRSFSTRPTRPRREPRPRPILFPRKSRSWRLSPSPNWPGR